MLEEELQAKALVFTSLIDFGASTRLKNIYLSYDDALEYAFQTSNHFEQAFSAQGIKQHSPEPYQWKDIKGRPDADLWEKAAMEEFVSLIENGTFEPVRLGRKPIGCRWVFQAQAQGRWICRQVQGKAGGQGLLTAARTWVLTSICSHNQVGSTESHPSISCIWGPWAVLYRHLHCIP